MIAEGMIAVEIGSAEFWLIAVIIERASVHWHVSVIIDLTNERWVAVWHEFLHR